MQFGTAETEYDCEDRRVALLVEFSHGTNQKKNRIIIVLFSLRSESK